MRKENQMGPNVILFGWNRSIPGRERTAAAHFQELVLHTQGCGAIPGATGDTAMERMRLWTSLLPA
jgi:hypothetical protein